MSNLSHISLIDLGKQLPFEIDDDLKEQLCFAETLIISCGHYDGEYGDQESTKSGNSCEEEQESEVTEEAKEDKMIEIKDNIQEEQSEPEQEEKPDFQIYFFPDCNKPLPPQDSKASIMIVDGLPQINPVSLSAAPPPVCTCVKDNKGKCICHTKLPCYCGAKSKMECKCAQLEKICICHEHKPNVVCTCKGSKVCVCFPDGVPRPICTCDKVEKPCLCHPGKFPSPMCTCKHKPKYNFDFKSDEYGLEWNEEEEKNENVNDYDYEMEIETITETIEEEEQEPCICQKPDPKPLCYCVKDKDCICNENTCICGVQKTCVCEPVDSQTDIICKSQESDKSICSCPDPIECTCDAKSTDCKCFPKNTVCTCGTPENCKCFKICDCINPCICDTLPEEEKKDCICLKKDVIDCTCPCTEHPRKLKKVRAGKHGYRWCHDVDPKHTYFDYGYGLHDKITYKEQEKEKFKILGLWDENEDTDVEAKQVKVPPFIKRVRRPCIDCCSAVGGISISVESIGEEKDKFLVQVVSHSSKEGAKTGSKLVSILDCNLHTLEENRIEHIAKEDKTKERKSYMAICDSGYYNKVSRICGDRDVVKRFYHSFEDAREFLLEGASVVLLRYIALRRYRGVIKTETVMMDGTICQSIYASSGVSQGVVNGKPMFVIKIERHIIEPSGFMHQTLTVVTLRGYIVSHEWADSSYLLHLNPLLHVDAQTDRIEPHAPLREKWREDLQLLSDYLDFKSTRSTEGARYVAENGELTATVRDYLQAVLLLKPNDVLHFTRHYFSSALSALDLPHDEYFDPCPKHVRYYFFED